MFKKSVEGITKSLSKMVVDLEAHADDQRAKYEKLSLEADVCHSEAEQADRVAARLEALLNG